MVALASAFVRLRPQVDRREYERAGRDGADAVIKSFAPRTSAELSKAITGGVDKGLDEARKRAAAQGGAGGKAWGDGFYRDANGKIRDAQGKFVASSVAGGDKAGKGFAKSFTKGSSGIVGAIKRNIGMAAGVFVPLGLAAAVGEIGKIGMAYEDNLNIFRSVSKATAAQMDTVAEKARQLGADVQLPGVSAAGAAAAMTELAKAGFTVQQSMDAARATLQLARVANISEADAAEIAANAVNAFGIQAKDTSFVVDELAAAANSSSIEISDASLAFKQAAAVFSGVQGPAVGGKEAITELNTAIAILGNNGIKGSDAGTSLKQMLLQLTGPTQQAKDQMTLLAERAGGANISLRQQTDVLHGSKSVREDALAQIAKMNPRMKDLGDIAYDSAGRMRPLKDIIGLVTAGTKGMTQEERNYAVTQIFGADASRAVIALMKGGLPVYDKQRKAITAQGAAAAFAAAKNAGLRGAVDNVRSQIENASISVYNAVKGPLTAGLNSFAAALPGIFAGISKTFGYLGQHIGTVKAFAIALGALVVVTRAHAAAMAVEAAGGIVKYIAGIRIVTAITKVWTATQWLLNSALFANPIGIAVLAIGALVAAIVIAYNKSETFRKIVQAVWAAIKVAFSATINWFVNTLWPSLKKAWDQMAAAAMWLWRNVIQPVWNGIKAAIDVAWRVIKVIIEALILEWRAVATVATWLYRNVIAPTWKLISKSIEIAWFVIKIALAAFKLYLQNVIFPIIKFLYNNVVKPIFSAIGSLISAWWTGVIRPVFNNVKSAFSIVGAAFGIVWRNVIRPVFQAFGNYISLVVAPAFRKGVDAIRTAWKKVQEAARVPVAFVVNHVINPFIGGLNAAAKVVGLKDRIDPIKGFASGGKITGAGGMSDNRQAMVAGLGPVQLMGGEFVVNREDTAKALPLLKWINSGMKGGADRVQRMTGKRIASEPGDGSEGWAFKDGGLIGWVKDVWGAISNPVAAIKKPFESALSNIPGVGMIKDFLVSSAKKLLGAATSWLTGGSGGSFASGKVGAAQRFVQAQNGKPYVWASAGPGGYDCSGIVSAAYNVLKGRNPYSHTFSTGSMPGPWFKQGQRAGALVAGWSHPGQAPASASVGHMAGQLGNMPFESRGSRGVIVGSGARRVGQFANIGAARLAAGGQVPVKVFDGGGAWPSGTIGANLSGRTEYVDSNRAGTSMSDVVAQLQRANARLDALADDIVEAQRTGVRRTARRSRMGGSLT